MYLSNSVEEVLSYFISHIDPCWFNIGFPNLYARVDVIGLRQSGLRPVEYYTVLITLVWFVPVRYLTIDLVPYTLIFDPGSIIEEQGAPGEVTEP